MEKSASDWTLTTDSQLLVYNRQTNRQMQTLQWHLELQSYPF